MIKFLIVRHGFSVSNKDGTFTGQIDAPLSEEGFAQAKLASEYILNNYKVDEIYSSDLCRAVDTVKLVADRLNLTIITDKGLREVFCGEWEGRKISEVLEKFPGDFVEWKKGGEDTPMTGGESMREVKARAMAVINRIAKAGGDKTVIVATHGGVIKTIQSGCLNVPYEELNKLPWANNASITEFHYSDGKFTLVKFGYDEYLGNLSTSMPKGI